MLTNQRLATGVVVKVFPARGYGFLKNLDTSREYFFHFRGRGKVLSSWGQQWPLVTEDTSVFGHHGFVKLPTVDQILRFMPDEIGRQVEQCPYPYHNEEVVYEKGPRADLWVTYEEYLKVIEQDRAHADLMRRYEMHPEQSRISALAS